MKRSEFLFNVVSIPVDIISLTLAGLAAFYLRIRLASHFPILFNLHLHVYLRSLALVIFCVLLLFAGFGLYNLRGTRQFSREFGKIVSALSAGFLILVLVFFFNQRVFASRLIVLIGFILGAIFVLLGRSILKAVQVAYLKRGYGLHRLVVIAGEGVDQGILDAVTHNYKLGYRVISELSETPELLQTLEQVCRTEHIDEILQANPKVSQHTNAALVAFVRSRGLRLTLVPNLFDVQRSVIETDILADVPVIALRNTPLEGWGKVAKRIFDILCSGFCFLITSPAFLAVAIAIKLDTPGKILYAAPRGGRNRDFTFLKFRTMYSHLSVGTEYGGDNAEHVRQELWKQNARGGESGPFLKIKDDPRVTRVGKFLRKTKLDEIPQFLNVLRGDMSMVGPRAHVIDEVERYRDRHRRLFTIKPGIFGLSQIAQISWPDLPFEEEVRLNTYYIEHWSIWLDIVILAKSFVALLFGNHPKENY